MKFMYEGECFPSQIISLNGSGYVTTSTTRSGFDWKWPQQENIMHYPFSDIKTKIATPVPKKLVVIFCSRTGWHVRI